MSYRVSLRPSGHTLTVNEGESILDAALRQGLMIPYSCRGGSCGSCIGRVLEGRVSYPQGSPPPALSQEDLAASRALFCLARPETDLVIEVREVRQASDLPPRKLPCRVARIEQLSHDVRRLYLKTPATERLQFLAGQYIDILLPGGKRRGFSLANAPYDDEFLELHIRLVPGGQFTRYVFEEMQPGALLRIEGPFGQFYLREDSPRPVLMMAGGTGFAPLKGMIEQANHVGDMRPIHFFWGVRAKRDLYLDQLPRAWAENRPGFRYTPVLSEPMAEDRWEGRTGLVHEALLQDYPDLSGFDIYMSGPPAMVSAARDAFLAHGAQPGQLFSDSFDFAVDPGTIKR